MTTHELAGAVAPRLRPRQHRPPAEIPLEVGGERCHRFVARLRLTADRGADDVVEIAGKFAGPARRRRGRLGRRAPAQRLARSGRLDRLDDAQDVGHRTPAKVERRRAGEQLVEHDAERVDVGRRRDLVAQDLLRRRVGRRERSEGGLRLPVVASERVVEDLRQPEVHELGFAFGGDEHIRRLDVAVHDQLAVRVGHRAADLQEERDARPRIEAVSRGIGDERLAGHVLHHEEGFAVGGDAAIEQPRDVRVRERRQDLALAAKVGFEIGRRHGAPDHLQRDVVAVLPVGAPREEHRAHAAAAELPHDLVGAHARAGGCRAPTQPPPHPLGLAFDRAVGVVGLREQGCHLSPQHVVVAAGLVEEGLPLTRRQVHGGVERRLQAAPVGGTHPARF